MGWNIFCVWQASCETLFVTLFLVFTFVQFDIVFYFCVYVVCKKEKKID